MSVAIKPLLSHYAFIQPDKSNYAFYADEQKKIEQQQSKYNLANQFYSEISHLHIYSDLKHKVDFISLTKNCYEKLKGMFEDGDFVILECLLIK